MTKIAIITGSVRENRINKQVADFVLETAKSTDLDAEFSLLDIKDYDLPVLDGEVPGALGKDYPDDKVQAWSDQVDLFDGYIFVTPEYNRNTSPALLNAIDHLFGEWGSKSAGLVGYGSTGGVAAVQVLRTTLANVGLQVVGQAADFNTFTEFNDQGQLQPLEESVNTVKSVLSDTVDLAQLLKSSR